MSADGGAGLPAERAGGTGTSENDLEDSKGLLMPRPALTWAGAPWVDEVRSGCSTVGVDGDRAGWAEPEGLRESPRAGRSTR